MPWAIDLLLISALASVLTEAAVEVKIKPSNDEKFIRPVSNSILFTCEVTGARESEVRIQWIDNFNREVRESTGNSRIYVERGESVSKKLYITNIDNRDAGRYQCVVLAGGSRHTKTVELTIYKDITFDHVPNPQHPSIYKDSTIECQVSGEPAPVVSWRYNGLTLDTGNRYTKLKNGLRIRNITLADDGNYTCRAEVESEGRYDERRITVAVHIPPEMIQGPGNVEVVEGKEATLSCRANGLPPPKFEFFRETRGKVLSSTGDITVDIDGGRITFHKLKKEDGGLYTCRALNDVGDASASGRLRVLVPPKIQEFKNITKSEGDIGSLLCRTEGDPPPEVVFFKRIAGILQPFKLGSHEHGRIVIFDRGSGLLELTIRNLMPSDATHYTCSSNNSAGYDNKTAVINVHYKPRFDDDHIRSVYSWAGPRNNITCHVQAEPTPTIQWIRYNRTLANNETYRIYNVGKNSSLEIRIKEADQSWIYGSYYCRAENYKGRGEIQIQLKRATVPNEPQDVTVKEFSQNQVVLQIDPPRENGGIRIVGYRVEYDSNVQDISIIGSVPVGLPSLVDETRIYRQRHGNSTSDRQLGAEFIIDNLRPGTKYAFKIRAKNEVGVGSSVERMVTTANLSRPHTIKVNSHPIGSMAHHYNVTWERPKTGGLPIIKYTFRYKKIPDGYEELQKKTEGWQTEYHEDDPARPIRSYILRSLTPNTKYQLEIVASNELGSSLPSSNFSFRTNVELSHLHSSCSSIAFYRLFGAFYNQIACLSLVISTFATNWIVEHAEI